MKFPVLVLATALCAGTIATGQSFEVASVKPSSPDAVGMSLGKMPGGGFKASNASLRFLVTFAYDIRNDHVFGGPAWLGDAKVDIVARAADPNTSLADMRLMLRSLLADRFHLKTHSESRNLQTYILKVDPRGLKIVAGPPIDGPDQNSLGMTGAGHLKGTGISADTLAKALSTEIGTTVEDQTGIAGVFSFTLIWSPDPMLGAVAPSDAGGDTEAGIFSALKEQLGLRLESRKEPQEVLVIDQVDRTPTAN